MKWPLPLGVSKDTVKTYFKRISQKLDVHGREELARLVNEDN
jgi:DNA-binding NarL/FixJ family response regulator